MNGNVVIVGSGHAGVSVAFKLRTQGFKGNITVIGEEIYLPYHRPPLSKKYIANLADEGRLYLKQESQYRSEKIDLRLNCRVNAIHRSEKQVELEDGERIQYDALVLATGARARSLSTALGGGAQNIHTLRNLSDAKRIRDALTQNKRLLVVGGGYIGLEMAAVARSLGLQVTLIERESRILGRVAAAQTAAYFKNLHEKHGVRVLEGVGIESLERSNDRIEKVRLSDGTVIGVDVVVVGIGVIPELQLAQEAGLQVANGIVVDRAGRTSDTAIYAVGDCASFVFRGQMIRLESVQNAVDMAEVVGLSIAGASTRYDCQPWFWSDQYTTKLQIAGLNLGYTQVAVRNKNETALSVWYFDQEGLIAVDSINDAKAFMTARKWLSSGQSPCLDDIANQSLELSAMTIFEKTDLVT
ncbi:MAG TPA: pyridine nucleotide-disulfide oxidoreductase [Advenella kashmirensis]|uniref:Pyridine nucleotide-disulfide oxidoreductase n=1 Tax=Advenella kashmirensis TaxID=310575 RepID=A0A356LNF4_9BURK|nr:pyridine nucleotide-disulfide oxidoreductase [Advenella kashmirensis]